MLHSKLWIGHSCIVNIVAIKIRDYHKQHTNSLQSLIVSYLVFATTSPQKQPTLLAISTYFLQICSDKLII